MNTWSVRIAIAGWVLFGIAMLLPALVSLAGPGGSWRVDLVGWEAAWVGVGWVPEFNKDWLVNCLTFLAALTNLVMLLSPWAIFRPHARVATATIGSGAYCWVSSVLAVTIAAYVARRGGTSHNYGVQLSVGAPSSAPPRPSARLRAACS
jgi:hypothetical protein